MTASLLTYSIDFITQRIHIIIATTIFVCLGIIHYNTQAYIGDIEELHKHEKDVCNERDKIKYHLNLEKELHKETKKNTLKTIIEIKNRLGKNGK